MALKNEEERSEKGTKICHFSFLLLSRILSNFFLQD